jgi:hypothetical protein
MSSHEKKNTKTSSEISLETSKKASLETLKKTSEEISEEISEDPEMKEAITSLEKLLKDASNIKKLTAEAKLVMENIQHHERCLINLNKELKKINDNIAIFSKNAQTVKKIAQIVCDDLSKDIKEQGNPNEGLQLKKCTVSKKSRDLSSQNQDERMNASSPIQDERTNASSPIQDDRMAASTSWSFVAKKPPAPNMTPQSSSSSKKSTITASYDEDLTYKGLNDDGTHKYDPTKAISAIDKNLKNGTINLAHKYKMIKTSVDDNKYFVRIIAKKSNVPNVHDVINTLDWNSLPYKNSLPNLEKAIKSVYNNPDLNIKDKECHSILLYVRDTKKDDGSIVNRIIRYLMDDLHREMRDDSV